MNMIHETSIAKNNKAHLDYLYYKINKQNDFRVNWQDKTTNNIINTHWLNYSELILQDSMTSFKRKWWYSKINNRTVLRNEIVLDYDYDTNIWNKADLFQNINHLKQKLLYYKKYHSNSNVKIQICDTTSKGIHIHIFDSRLCYMNEMKRQEHRLRIFKHMEMYKEKNNEIISIKPEHQKKSEGSMIAILGTKHHKTGKLKKLIEEI